MTVHNQIGQEACKVVLFDFVNRQGSEVLPEVFQPVYVGFLRSVGAAFQGESVSAFVGCPGPTSVGMGGAGTLSVADTSNSIV